MSTSRDLGQLACGVIEHFTKEINEPAGVAAELTSAFARFEQQTVSMVGGQGYDALKQRALYLTRSDLKIDPALSSIDLMLLLDQSWDLTVQQVGKLAACQCAAALLGQVFRLLSSFICEDLTVRIVRRTWTELDPTTLDRLRREG